MEEIQFNYKVYSPNFNLKTIDGDTTMLFLGMNIKETVTELAIKALKSSNKKIKELVTGDSYQSVTSFLVDNLTEKEINSLKMFGLSVFEHRRL